MSDKNYILPAPETVSMSGDAARRLIGCGSGDAALLYIYILSSGGRFDPEDAAVRTGRTGEQIERAMSVLVNLGLVTGGAEKTPAPARPDELPQYTAEDISRELSSGAVFPSLVKETQRALDRILSSDDLIRLFGIYDYLGLPPEVILQLVTHCRTVFEKRNGHGRMPSMRYIEKAAFSWEREGIFSLEAAEAYIKRTDERMSAYTEFAAAVGAGSRQLSATERRYVDSWQALGFTADAAAIAYDRTVMNTGKLSWNYMDSIMKSWHKKGLHSPAEIEAGDGFVPRGETKKAEEHSDTATTAEDMDRMRETLKRIKGGGL